MSKDTPTMPSNETTPLVKHQENILSPLLSSPSHEITVDNNETMYGEELQRNLSKARKLLYTSHTISQFSEQCWQFCLVLFLSALTNYKSLVLVSTYGLTSGLFVCLTGSTAGSFVDSKDHDRLYIAQFFIWSQNLCVVLATLCCFILLRKTEIESVAVADSAPLGITTYPQMNSTAEEMDHRAASIWLTNLFANVPVYDFLSIGLLIGIHLLGAVAVVLDQGFTVAIERDWIVVMSKLFSDSFENDGSHIVAAGDSNDDNEKKKKVDKSQQNSWLSETNVTMKQIDLSCRIVAPAIAGFFIAAFDDTSRYNNNDEGAVRKSGSDLASAALLIGALNIISLSVEYSCSKAVYHLIPTLGSRRKKAVVEMMKDSEGNEEDKDLENTTSSSNALSSSNGNSKSTLEEENDETITKLKGCIFCRPALPKSLKIYFEQPVCYAGIALALLYLNILSFGGLMTGYLVWRGMNFDTIGVWRGISSAIGLGGTLAFRLSNKHLSLYATGMWSIIMQFACLTLSYASLFVNDLEWSLSMLIAGVCTSRVGLWVFDIAITQFMQQFVAEDVRGVVGGVQKSLHAFFGLMNFVLGILFPDPKYFYILVATGYSAVGVAMFFYAFGVFLRREKLSIRLGG